MKKYLIWLAGVLVVAFISSLWGMITRDYTITPLVLGGVWSLIWMCLRAKEE